MLKVNQLTKYLHFQDDDTTRYKLRKAKDESNTNIIDVHIAPYVEDSAGKWIRKGKHTLCGKILISDTVHKNDTKVKTAQDIRIDAAKIGRQVCGQCIAVLYSDNDRDKK